MTVRKILIPFFTIFLIFSAILLCCCGDKRVQLATPQNLRVNAEDYLEWDAVENASKYEVEIDGEVYTTEENKLDIFEKTLESRAYQIQVIACGDWVNYTDSEMSEVYTRTLDLNGNFLYRELADGTLEIMSAGRDVSKGKTVIPESIEGKTVTKLAREAFLGCKDITSAYIPDCVTEVGAAAFQHCTKLTRIRFPAYIEKIGNGGLQFCESLKTVILPVGLKEIPSGFLGYSNTIEEIVLSHTMEEIDGLEFSCLDSLKKMTFSAENPFYEIQENSLIRKEDSALIYGGISGAIPDGIKKLEGWSLCGTNNIVELNIPASVTEIGGKYDFQSAGIASCPNLVKLTVDKDNPVFKSENNCIIRKSDNTLIAGCASSVIPDYVEAIGQCAFEGCKNLRTINLSENINEIGNSSFSGSGLRTLNIPQTVTKINSKAFSFCSELTEVRLPVSIKEIGKEAFAGCAKLKYLFIPDGVEKIEGYAFGSAMIGVKESVGNSLGSVTLCGNIEKICEYAISTEVSYVEWQTKPDGWLLVARESMQPIVWTSSRVYKGCVFKYDGEYPYVYSMPINGVLPFKEFAPTRYGYICAGYTTVEGGSKVEYVGESVENYGVSSVEYKNGGTAFDGNIILYPVWVPCSGV